MRSSATRTSDVVDELDEVALVGRLVEGAAVAFDTNILHQRRTVVEVAEGVKKANASLESAGKGTICAVIPAICWAELVLHQRHEYPEGYDESRIERALIESAMSVEDFTKSDGKAVAGYISGAYPDKVRWQKAKVDSMLSRLALADAPGKSVPATVDWYIAGQAMARNWILVTEDSGAEFKGRLERTTLATLKSALRQLGDTTS